MDDPAYRPRTYTVRELAQILRMSEIGVRGLIRRKVIPAVKIGHSVRVWAEDLEALRPKS